MSDPIFVRISGIGSKRPRKDPWRGRLAVLECVLLAMTVSNWIWPPSDRAWLMIWPIAAIVVMAYAVGRRHGFEDGGDPNA